MARGKQSSGVTHYDAIVAEANRIDDLSPPYVYGGGHTTPAPRNGPFDCSSAVSRVLQAAGYDLDTMTSGSLMSWGEAGEGQVTIYANEGHVFMRIGERYWGTSVGDSGSGGTGWHGSPSSSYLSTFTARHPPDLDGSAGTDPGRGGTSAGNDLGSFSEEDLFAIGRAAATSSQFQLAGLLDSAESLFMTGAKSIYNDESLLPFIEQLCKSSMRSFQTLPNGAFFAFFPDPFGLYGHRKPYWNIDNVEIIDGGIDLSDEELATHVFVVGDTGPDFLGDGQASLVEKQNSKGVVTIFDAFTSDHMIATGSNTTGDKVQRSDKEDQKKLRGYEQAQSFLRKYGVRPHYEEATFIRNGFFEVFYAYSQFQLLWANQYRTQFTFTFMPELYPGGVVAFEEHGIRCYVDEVTHSFDYANGFTTTANLSAPASLKDSDSPIAAGMVLPFFSADPKKKDKDK